LTAEKNTIQNTEGYLDRGLIKEKFTTKKKTYPKHPISKLRKGKRGQDRVTKNPLSLAGLKRESQRKGKRYGSLKTAEGEKTRGNRKGHP